MYDARARVRVGAQADAAIVFATSDKVPPAAPLRERRRRGRREGGRERERERERE